MHRADERWEKGRREPRGRHLAKVREFLGEEPDALSLADRLKRYRSDHGPLQREMAAKLEVHECTYQEWETGRREPRADLWPRVEAVLKDAGPGEGCGDCSTLRRFRRVILFRQGLVVDEQVSRAVYRVHVLLAAIQPRPAASAGETRNTGCVEDEEVEKGE